MIKVNDLVGGYGQTKVIKNLHLEVRKGEFFSLLGPNGSGKTTLFKLITGQLPIERGDIEIEGKPMSSLTKLEKARKIAVLSQEIHVSFDYTVEEIISLGRYPYQKGMLKRLSSHDWDVIERVMKISKVDQFRNTQFRMISGGEKQRVLLAKALAQEPELLLLDEPTNHLDIKHTFQMLDLLKEWQLTKGLTVFAILHDLNVASLYSDRIALLHEGSLLKIGDVNILRKEDQLKKVYEVDVKTQSHPTIPKPQLLMTPQHSTKCSHTPFDDSFSIERWNDYVYLKFDEPLRTISNGIIGEGIQWMRHYCFVSGHSKEELVKWMKDHHIPLEQVVGLMTVGRFTEMVHVKQQIDGYKLMAFVVMERLDEINNVRSLKTINTMVFIDGYATDGAIIDGYMMATEAKMKAIHDLNGNGMNRAQDGLVLAIRQREESQMDEEMKKKLQAGIKQVVYEATSQALQKRSVNITNLREVGSR